MYIFLFLVDIIDFDAELEGIDFDEPFSDMEADDSDD